MSWLDPDELRVGLGCMRLPEGDAAIATIEAAVDAGITLFDTARAYEENEQRLGRVLAAAKGVRIVTKGGMSRPGGAWVPDGRARSIRADCEASLAALDGLGIDLYLLHAPDPRTPWRTSVRALARLVDEGLVARVGVCNVNRAQLDEALEIAPISAVQVALSVLDDRAVRGGLLDRCAEVGISLAAHSPLGGPRRAGSLARHQALAAIAKTHGVTVAEAALAWVLGLAPNIVVVAGARRPDAARSAARAATLALTDAERASVRPRARSAQAARKGDVVVIMGIPGAGKSRVAAEHVERGYARLNRDERGGTLRDIANALDEALASGTREAVLDNTYLTRATRSYVVEAASHHGVPARCIWLDTPLAHAQVNLVERLLDRFGALPTPEQLKSAARSEPGLLSPTQQMRTFRELEPPTDDEGFAAVERVPFARAPSGGRPGVFVAAAAAGSLPLDGVDRTAPHLVFDWLPAGTAGDLDELAEGVTRGASGPVETAVCPHPGGPPICWCRPPLPGLALAFAHSHGIDTAQSVVVGVSPAHRTLANALGARFVHAGKR